MTDDSTGKIPLLKFLTNSGAGSRRKMADAVKEGRVIVNGQTAEDFRLPIDPTHDHVRLDGRAIKADIEKFVYLMMNKPAGVLTTTQDERGRKLVLDILPAKYRGLRLYPVGRLDKDSTGLLLLTNDGDMTNRLTHPRYEHDKEYYLRIKGRLTEDEMKQLSHGVRLEDGITAPAKLREIKGQPGAYSLTIHEGKKRQIRRMFARFGYHVQELKRVRSGNLTLGNLKEGEVRELTPREVSALLQPATQEKPARRSLAQTGLTHRSTAQERPAPRSRAQTGYARRNTVQERPARRSPERFSTASSRGKGRPSRPTGDLNRSPFAASRKPARPRRPER